MSEKQDGLIKIRRDNVVLRVPKDKKSYYMEQGYDVIEENGRVIEETTPTDIATLQRFYKDAKKKIAELEAEIKTLKAQPKQKKEADTFTAMGFEDITTQPVRRRRKNKE